MHGFDAYRIFERLLDEALDERRSQRGLYERPSDPLDDIEQEVKLVYARGDIDARTYRRLLEMAQSGELGWDDLARVRSEQATNVRQEQKPPERERDAKIVSSLNRLYRHRTRLESTRDETTQVLQRLETDVARFREQADAAEEKAQIALPDEEKARAFLETRQEALDRVDSLEERIASLRQSLRRVDTLRDELATREAELKALESGERLAELEADIREDLLNG